MHTESKKSQFEDQERMDQFYRQKKADKKEQHFFKNPDINQLFLDGIYNTQGREFLAYLAKGGTAKDWFGMTDEQIELSYVIAKKLYDSNHYDRALIEFLRLAMMDPYDSRFFLGVGHCHLMLKEYKDAYENYHYAVIYNSKEVRPYFFAAEAALKMEDENSADYAKHFYKQVIELCQSGVQEPDIEEMLAVAKAKLSLLDQRSQKN